MREILYKAKRITDGEWIYGSYVYAFCEDKNCPVVGVKVEKHWIVEESGNMVWVDKDTICQCTGLKDKNSKLIWENDIVHNGNYFVVKWNLSCARFDFALNNSHNIPVGRWEPMIIDWKNSDFKEYRNNIDFEVIGNIFDNKELLESEG